ncbi:MAG TPA: rhomboid family intramembrane serine protease [Cytophagales bacterium]|nr:rhomboid family intramembrane serine protease [Cytophagales bacterium]HAA21508.1 rhomboid family intramembrane serine protease [Cytophagales bacterium]HAP64641.1 rhomboid family intramembrane serine protease [Cytophagales bacterium]
MISGFSVTSLLVLVNVVATIYAWRNPHIQQAWMLNPYQIQHRKQYYRFITSGFIHANWAHLLFNMIALWSFGEVVEIYFYQLFGSMGTVYYLVMYFMALVVSDLTTFWKYRDIPNYNALGASGATSAVVFASVFFSPWSQVLILFIPMPGIIMAVLYLIYSYSGSTRQFGDNINHDAHLFGALFGWLFIIVLKPDLIFYFLEVLMEPELF